MYQVYLSIGSNLGDRQKYLEKALNSLNELPTIELLDVSPLYETAPYGPIEQDNFYNATVRLNTSLEPEELLTVLQAQEIAAKRIKEVKWGPRTLDLDIIWFDGQIIETDRLTIPHKEAKNRRFVIEPLLDIWQTNHLFDSNRPDYQLKEGLQKVKDQDLTLVESNWYPAKGLLPTQLHQIEEATRMILTAIGEDIHRPGLKDTPKRVARMYAEVFSGLINAPFDDYKMFDTKNKEGMVLVKDIQFYSMCEHHLLPFFGKAHIAYIPKKNQVLGLSKLARLVEDAAARPSVQEDLTIMIAERLFENASVAGVAVAISAEHMCMTMRGVRTPHSYTKTYAFEGVFKEKDYQQHFLDDVQ